MEAMTAQGDFQGGQSSTEPSPSPAVLANILRNSFVSYLLLATERKSYLSQSLYET